MLSQLGGFHENRSSFNHRLFGGYTLFAYLYVQRGIRE
jgi:hypothetical protein